MVINNYLDLRHKLITIFFFKNHNLTSFGSFSRIFFSLPKQDGLLDKFLSRISLINKLTNNIFIVCSLHLLAIRPLYCFISLEKPEMSSRMISAPKSLLLDQAISSVEGLLILLILKELRAVCEYKWYII